MRRGGQRERNLRASRRRQALYAWIMERPAHQGLSALEIVEVSGIYDGLQGRYDKCVADLNRLHRDQLVVRSAGRPARWS